MDKLYQYLSPFIAAVLASYITHMLMIRSKKFDVLFQERIPACKAILKRLVSIKRYCLAGLAEYSGSEFSPRLEDLPEHDQGSALTHRTDLSFLAEENQIFLSKSSRRALIELDAQLGLLCNVELQLAGSQPHADAASLAEDTYGMTVTAIDECIDRLYNDLKLPR